MKITDYPMPDDQYRPLPCATVIAALVVSLALWGSVIAVVLQLVK